MSWTPPFNQTSYTSRLMEDQQARFVSDVLGNDPTARADGNPTSGADWFSIRGFGLGNGDIRFNGLAGVAPAHFNSMMSESIERVEVLKGPNAMIAGAEPLGGVGGTINVVAKRAPDEKLAQFTIDYSSRVPDGRARRRRGPLRGEPPVRRALQRCLPRRRHRRRPSERGGPGWRRWGSTTAVARLRLSSDPGYQYQDLRGTRGPVAGRRGRRRPRAPSNR